MQTDIRSLSQALVIGLISFSFSPNALCVPSDLTRHLDEYVQDAGPAGSFTDTFFGTAGSATLRVTNGVDSDPTTKVTRGQIKINDVEVLAPIDFAGGDDQIEIPIDLVADDNTIFVKLECAGAPGARCETGSQLKVRVKQTADITMNWTTRIHFNTNVSDYDSSRQFYADIGFSTGSGFPDTNTLEVARSLGIHTPTHYDGSLGPEAGGYVLHGNLIALGTAGGVFIDLIEFTIPRNDEPPYANLNHLGMARATLLTTDLNADFAYMTGLGVEFLSAPVTRSNLTRFAIFKDPDGTFYELLEVPGVPVQTSPTNIVAIGPVSINVSDFERSRAFYQMLGFEIGVPLAETESLEVAQAMGLSEPYQIQGELIAGYGTEIELVQWISPYDPTPPYPLPINHLGIHRIAYVTADLDADVAALKSQGIEFISPVAPCCSGPESGTGIVSFFDPDGTIIELFGTVEPQEQQDTDGDGLFDREDNCIDIPNVDQCDTNFDGFGNVCDADLDGNRIVNTFDLAEMRNQFGATGENDADLDCNGVVNSFDLNIMRESFGGEPGRSGIVWP